MTNVSESLNEVHRSIEHVKAQLERMPERHDERGGLQMQLGVLMKKELMFMEQPQGTFQLFFMPLLSAIAWGIREVTPHLSHKQVLQVPRCCTEEVPRCCTEQAKSAQPSHVGARVGGGLLEGALLRCSAWPHIPPAQLKLLAQCHQGSVCMHAVPMHAPLNCAA